MFKCALKKRFVTGFHCLSAAIVCTIVFAGCSSEQAGNKTEHATETLVQKIELFQTGLEELFTAFHKAGLASETKVIHQNFEGNRFIFLFQTCGTSGDKLNFYISATNKEVRNFSNKKYGVLENNDYRVFRNKENGLHCAEFILY